MVITYDTVKEEHGSRHQQWEDELMEELASHRNNNNRSQF